MGENKRFFNLGIATDYYIALGLKYKGFYEFPYKKFYWCHNNFLFAEIPTPNAQNKEKVDTMDSNFTGEPEKVLIEVENKENAEENKANEEGNEKIEGKQEDSESEDKIKIIPKNLTELDRLAYVVAAIENDCQTVPNGSFKLTPQHELRREEYFKGLKCEELIDIKNYSHFRNVQTEEKKDFIERDDAIFYTTFLDPIEVDQPQGAWTFHLDSTKSLVNLRNLKWPGYIAFHKAGSSYFGGIYIGDGLINADLPFML